MSIDIRSDTILLIDAYGHIYRSFFAIRHLTDGSGQEVNAVYGMARLLLNLDRSSRTDYGAVVYDSGRCRRRCALLPEYKAQRPPMPAALRSQLGCIREWFAAFGWPVVEKPGLEADDLLAAIAGQRRAGQQVGILSFDKDVMQLVGDGVEVLAPGPKGTLLATGEPEVLERFGVRPGQIVDYLAMTGDSADNIAGVAGIGPRTAARLLAEHGDLDGILDHLQDIGRERLRAALESSRKLLERNRDLVRLDRVLPDGWQGLQDIRRAAPDWDRIEELAARHQFGSFLETIRKRRREDAQPELF